MLDVSVVAGHLVAYNHHHFAVVVERSFDMQELVAVAPYSEPGTYNRDAFEVLLVASVDALVGVASVAG